MSRQKVRRDEDVVTQEDKVSPSRYADAGVSPSRYAPVVSVVDDPETIWGRNILQRSPGVVRRPVVDYDYLVVLATDVLIRQRHQSFAQGVSSIERADDHA